MYTHLDLITPSQLRTNEGPSGRFYITPEGNTYPSITTILGDGEKPWLVDWRNALGNKKADKVSKEATDRGTAVHLMIERLLNNELSPERGQHHSHVCEFHSLKLFLKNIDNIITQESALWSDIMKVAGRVDCIGEYEGKRAIIDFKTSTRGKPQTQVQDYFLQTTAYALMFNEVYGIEIEDIVIIMSVENDPVPSVFKRKTEQFIEPLLTRISTYHEARIKK